MEVNDYGEFVGVGGVGFEEANEGFFCGVEGDVFGKGRLGWGGGGRGGG